MMTIETTLARGRRYNHTEPPQRPDNARSPPNGKKPGEEVKRVKSETSQREEQRNDIRIERIIRLESSSGSGSGDRFKQEATSGKLYTTPSRLFKLLIPLRMDNRKTIETIAILVHTQQPLSYLEKLIQTELAPIKAPDGQTRPPAISFIAQQLEDTSIRPRRKSPQAREGTEDIQELEEEGESRPDAPEKDFVRWSQTTEIGDFVRDAARAGMFIVAIEGMPAGLEQIQVTVPSFEERTYYLRMRLRKVAERIQDIAEIKHECDALAHRGAQRVALGGFGVLASWWYIVYRLTFETDLGWDTMEPVTYLASLSTLMGGYLWFLYHNREISYRSALDFTISARQKKLYQVKGVDLELWEHLVDEGNALRKEIKNIAADYHAEWDERRDERDDKVTEALREREREEKRDEKKEEKRSGDEPSSGSS